MKRNIGTLDENVRIVLSMAITISALCMESWWGLLAIVPLTTAFVKWCPVYSILNWRTNKRRIGVH